MDTNRFSTMPRLHLALCAVFALTRPVAAQGDGQADALFQSGLNEMQAGNYASGCPKLAESYRLDPLPGALFTLAECEAAWGKVATAIEHYQSFVDGLVALPPARRNKFDERRRLALEKIAALNATAPEITVEVAAGAPESLLLKRNGEPLEPSSYGVARKVDPGQYLFTAQIADQPSWQRSVTLAVNDRALIQVPWPLQAAAVSEAQGPAEREALPRARHPSPLRAWFYASGAVGIAGLAAGAIAGGIALAKKKVISAHCPERQCDEKGHAAAASGKRAALASTVGFAVGLAGAAAAATLFFLERRSEARPARAFRRGLKPTLLSLRAGAGLGVEGSWP